MPDQFKYIKINEKDKYTVRLRPKRINKGSNPDLMKTLSVIDHPSRICAVKSIEELVLFTNEYQPFLNPGDLAMLIDTFSGLTQIFVWVNSTIRWQEVGPGEIKKEIVFVLGSDLVEGSQYASEIWFPYKGIIKNVFINLGEGSSIDTKLSIGVEMKDDSGWANKESFVISPGDDLGNLVFRTDLPINKNKIRIYLANGNYDLIKNMSIVIQIRI